jgi:hypothetical protein
VRAREEQRRERERGREVERMRERGRGGSRGSYPFGRDNGGGGDLLARIDGEHAARQLLPDQRKTTGRRGGLGIG